MDTVALVYAKGTVANAIQVLCDACRDYGFTPWALDGPPAPHENPCPTIARRIGIIPEPVSWDSDFPSDKLIGTANVIRITGGRTRIAFRLIDLEGASLPTDRESKLASFSHWFMHFVESKGLRLRGVDPEATTRPLSTPPWGS